MLKEIRVKNYAIIDDLTVEFHSGLNILTGETGAGKSIIVGALGLALGQRAYTEMIKTGQKEASVEAYFETSGHPLLEELDINPTGGLIIRRNLSSSGKTRAYINDTMVSVQSLSALGRALVDMHGQHDHQSLLSTDKQLLFLDHYGGFVTERAAIAVLFEETKEIGEKLHEIRHNAKQRAERLDLLRFQISEIESASLSEGEDQKLQDEKRILSNLNRLNELIESSYSLLYGSEGSCTEDLSVAIAEVKEMSSLDKSLINILEVLEQAHSLVEDASFSIRDIKDKYDMDPGHLIDVEDRLELIGSLMRKYGGSIEEVLGYRETALREAAEMEASEETETELQAALDEKTKELMKAATDLSEKRHKSSKRLESAIKKVLSGLALEKSAFSVTIKDAPISSSGKDAVELLFSANQGEDLKPLNKVASGGELSRIMLSLKSITGSADDLKVLIFDEVDAGIGGKTAQNVAQKLKEISKDRQVLCITHLPQIASAADNHYLIEKGLKEERVSVNVKELTGKDRHEEIARMLSGSVTDTSLEHAREIINRRD
jgi:DNA repair protein RecN (Recombination protein N)